MSDKIGIAGQNGHLGFRKVPDSAELWLYREFDLTKGGKFCRPSAYMISAPHPAPTGTHNFYYRNTEIVSSDGAVQTFLSDDASAIVTDDSFP